ncbi:MarR family winged helix-turn-helix transcriptional regulator [Clostridium thermarum]|uniref:MarR family winged helix-turn-helix transcriptional regulator n=1 Tax=Clostridium thermarum TaxID=1716543 RepID=UPI0011225A08|nr:MarR family transcriptional regulator [Clostridium thermarum]
MQEKIIRAAEEIAMFCRLQMYTKKGLPIKSSEMGVLIYVQKQNEGVTPLMISNFFQIAKPSVTAMVNELVRKGYLVKIPSPTDRRSYVLSITDKGIGLVTSTHEEYFKSIALLEKKMGTKDFRTFIDLMEKANTILSKERK